MNHVAAKLLERQFQLEDRDCLRRGSWVELYVDNYYDFTNVHADYDVSISIVKDGDDGLEIGMRVHGLKDDYRGYALPTHEKRKHDAFLKDDLDPELKQLAERAGVEV